MTTTYEAWLVRSIGIQGCSDFLLQLTVIFTRSRKTQLEIAAFNSKPRRA
ncbi:MAG: hypothetical protein LH628_10335 [Microcoleus sp. CAN_BIN18]|nr:hypothetical protein [Microcoleus sp. CAN_BIN18]